MQNDTIDDQAPQGTADRRHFLRLGGGAVVGAAVLAACGSSETSPPAETGDAPLESETTLAPPQTTSPEVGAETDAAVVRTGRSLELAAVEAYTVLLGEAEPSTAPDALALPAVINLDPEVTEAFTLMRERHQSHAAAMITLVASTGGDAVTEPNNGALQGILGPSLPNLTSQLRLVDAAHVMEDLITSTLAWGAGVVTTPELRAGIMELGAVSARQSAALSMLLDSTGASAVTGPTIDTSGPARVPDFMILTAEQDGGDVPATASEAADAAAPADDAAAEGEEEGG